MMKSGSTANNLLALTLLLVPFVLQAVDALLPWFAARPRRAAAAAVLCLLWVGWRVGTDLPTLWRRIAAHDEELAAARRLEEVVRTAPRPLWLPTNIALAYGNGLPVVTPAGILKEYDFDPAVFRPILAQLDAAAFETILLPDGFYDLLPEEAFAPLLAARYRPVEIIGTSPAAPAFPAVTVLERRR
jgi:hypothetical protein